MVLTLVKGATFFFVTGLGFVGNMFVLVNYIFMFEGTQKKSIHLIFIHLTFTNIMILLLKGIPKTIALDMGNFFDEIGCKIIVYFTRMARGLSICTSSLLTLVQAIIISPRDSVWRKLKLQSEWHILLPLLFFWILNSLISINLLFHIKNSSMNTSQISKHDNYCYFVPDNLIMRWSFLTLMVLRDAVFQGIMGMASGYMVFLLHKHHQRVLYLQNSNFLCKTPPEMKATQNVLFLMLCFLFFYWTDCFLSLYLTLSLENDSTTLAVQEFLSLGYALFSPFVLIPRGGHLAECWQSH
ncbi:vomeronasal type-1 receptor 51-like [Dipodomys spectabilis]|uniref:vomeronasal type-1 receptor 51-like n=1 Tax=Dipodomys spectabilis TaxID=105255 RepID=UPI001C53CA3A|nr:vomeronasal type-1 receptor 51-like [Dipodomys spectabilis]